MGAFGSREVKPAAGTTATSPSASASASGVGASAGAGAGPGSSSPSSANGYANGHANGHASATAAAGGPSTPVRLSPSQPDIAPVPMTPPANSSPVVPAPLHFDGSPPVQRYLESPKHPLQSPMAVHKPSDEPGDGEPIAIVLPPSQSPPQPSTKPL